MKSFTMIVCAPKQAPYVSIVKADNVDTLAVLQSAVGGHIETCARRSCGTLTLDAYCNEDEPDSTPHNRMMPNGPVRGTVVVTAANAQGETVSLEGEHLAQAMAWAESWAVNMSSAAQEANAAKHGHKCGPACVDGVLPDSLSLAIRETALAIVDIQVAAMRRAFLGPDVRDARREVHRLNVLVVELGQALDMGTAIAVPKPAPKARDTSKEN